MALTDPLQWVVIAVVAIVFLMWGPKKIPDLARSIGLARKEYSNASQELNKVTTGLKNPSSMLDVLTQEPAPQTVTSHEQQLPAPQSPASIPSVGTQTQANEGEGIIVDTARRLGIPTDGKTSQEISEEIVKKAQAQP